MKSSSKGSRTTDGVDQPLKKENELDRIRNQLKKTILKLVFSYAGIDSDIDDEIAKLKNNLRYATSEDDRRLIIEKAVEVILARADKIKSGFAKGSSGGEDRFLVFLNRLSLPGELNDELLNIRQQVEQKQQEQQYLELIDKTVNLICSTPDSHNNHTQLIGLMEQLVLPGNATLELGKIRDQLNRGTSSSMKEINKKIAKVINGIHAALQRELDDIHRYLNKLIGQLSVLYRHLEASQREQGFSCMEAEKLNDSFQQEKEQLHNEIESAQTLDQLKSCIDDHMIKIQSSLDEHLQSERQRMEATEERVSELKTRLHEMESESLNLKEKLSHEHNNAHRDVLTGIPNRLSYDEQIKKEIARSQRYRQPLTLALIDIDHFKKVNDRFGHKAGDKVLKAVATVCKENIRESDFLARYGGEEFALLLPETDREEAAIAVENLRRVVESCNFYHHSQTVLVTISIGYAEVRPEECADDIFHRADMALYSAKGTGRNKCLSDLEVATSAA